MMEGRPFFGMQEEFDITGKYRGSKPRDEDGVIQAINIKLQ